MAKVERPEIVTETHLNYLDGLQKSGVTNMFGAGAYVEGTFAVSRRDAQTILGYWMESYEERH